MFTVIRHYKNHKTGETWTKKADRAYKTKRLADAAAQRFTCTVKPDGKTAVADYTAEVIEIKGAK